MSGRWMVSSDADAAAVCESRHAHVEARVVYQYEHVGAEGLDVAAALPELPEDGWQVARHLGQTEEGGVAVVFGQIRAAARRGHHVAAPEAERGGGVGLEDAAHEVCAVQVARGLARYEVISHKD